MKLAATYGVRASRAEGQSEMDMPGPPPVRSANREPSPRRAEAVAG